MDRIFIYHDFFPAEKSHLHHTSCPMVSCLQPEDYSQYVSDNTLYSVAPGEGQRPQSIFTSETQAFPYLFPDGNKHFKDLRTEKLGLNRYFNSRLFSADHRFAKDPQYIFFAQFTSELQQINSSVSIAMRKQPQNEITADQLTDPDKRKKIISSDKGYRFLQNIRGTPAYWERTLRDLYAMVKQLGIPTWFCSFSAADRRWPEICETILRQQEKDIPDDMDWETHCRTINSNPVTACRMFENRVQHFIHDVILSPAEPIGHITDYFFRTEFQTRGWPHIHCLFWSQNAPKFDGSEDNEEFNNYIDRYITCRLPDDNDETLNEIVKSVQTHSKSHTPSCRKGRNKNCRFKFPRPPSSKTFIAKPLSAPDDVSPQAFIENARKILSIIRDEIDSNENEEVTFDDILIKLDITQEMYEVAHCALAKRNHVIFKRNPSDAWVNPYNEHLLQAWNGNMDIQPVLDAYSCIMYIVSYISKQEREMGDLLKRAQEEATEGHKEPIQQLRQLGNVYLHNREVSIMEAIYRVSGMHLKNCTREVVFLPTDPQSLRLVLTLSNI